MNRIFLMYVIAPVAPSLMTRMEDVSVFHIVQTPSGAHRALYPKETSVFSPEVKRQRQLYLPLPLSDEVKKACSYTSTVPYALMPWCLISQIHCFAFSYQRLFGIVWTNMKRK
jgi:hypothetical protein